MTDPGDAYAPLADRFSRRDLVCGIAGTTAVIAGIADLAYYEPPAAAQAAARRAERVGRFDRLRMVAESRNPIGQLAPDNDSYGPTVIGSVFAIGMDHRAGHRLVSAATSPAQFTLFGGTLHRRYDDWQALAVSYPDRHPAQNTGRVAFATDAESFDIAVGSSATAGYRVLVDGRYISRRDTLTATPQGARQYLRVTIEEPPDGAVPGKNRFRRIDVEMFSPEGAFSGVALPPTAVLRPVTTNGYRIACFGDSLATGTGCLNQNDGWATVAGYLLGGVDVDMLQVALGGTGFISEGPSWRGIRHIRDLVAQPIDEVWIELGINDANYAPSEVTPAALRFFKAVRALLPDAPVVVCGIARDDTERAFLLERAIAEAFRIWEDTNSLWVPLQVPGQKLFSANVDSVGNFVPNRYGGGLDGTDNTHPNVRGHLHFARFFAGRRIDRVF